LHCPHTFRTALRWIRIAACVLAFLAPQAAVFAQGLVNVVGTVVDRVGRPVSGADVVATDPRTQRFARTVSGEAGRFALGLELSPARDLLVFSSHPEIGVVRVRVNAYASDSALRLELRPSSAQALAARRVTASQTNAPERLDRDAAFAGVGGGEQNVNAIKGSVGPDEIGSVWAGVELNTALSRTGNEATFLGSTTDQNVRLSDGLGVGSERLPRLSRSAVKLLTSPIDIANGGFAGVAVSITPSRAQKGYATRNLAVLVSPYTGGQRLGRAAPGGAARSIALSGALTRTAFDDRIGMNGSFDLRSTSSQGTFSLVDAANVAESASLTGALQTLQSGGVLTGGPSDRVTGRELIALLRLDDMRPGHRGPSIILSAEAYQSPASRPAFSATSLNQRGKRQALSVQVSMAPDFGLSPAWLIDTRAGARVSTSAWSSFSDAPTVTIRSIDTDFLGFGSPLFSAGGGPRRPRQRAATVEGLIDVQHSTASGANTLKLVAWSRADVASIEAERAPRVSVLFPNTQAVIDTTPFRYAVAAMLGPRRTTTLHSAIGLANQTTIRRQNKIYLGVRIDASSLLNASGLYVSPLGPASRLPIGVKLSPRIGVDWFTRRMPTGWIQLGGPVTDPFIVREPVGIFRIGFGRFVGRLTPETQAIAGLTSRQLTNALECRENELPAVSWQTLISGPAQVQCRDGPNITATGPLAAAVLGSALRPPDAWRANVSYSAVLLRTRLQVDARWSRTSDGLSFTDRNLRASPTFALANEAQRPVFFDSTSTQSSSGLLAGQSGRADTRFGRVLVTGSEGVSTGGAVTIQASPEAALRKGRALLSVEYTLARTTRRANGFTSTTAGDPRVFETSLHPGDARHRIVIQSGIAASGLLFSGRISGQSGLPFTPVVASDINGDGLVNDRAFVPSLSQEAERSIRSRGAVRCLVNTRSSIAKDGACRGPWSLRSQLRLESLRGVRVLGSGARMRIAAQVSEPIGAMLRAFRNGALADRLSALSVDPVLLLPSSFRLAQRAFEYRVNPNFGTVSATSLARPSVSIDVSIDLTPPFERQLATRLLGEARRGEVRVTRSAARLREVYAGRMLANWDVVSAEVLRMKADRATLDSLQRIGSRLRVDLDSLWRPVTERAASLVGLSDIEPFASAMLAAERRMWNIVWSRTADAAAQLLTDAEVDRLSGSVRFLLRRRASEGYVYVTP
jgi:hypothetical protein